jgi:hypothetical protein
MTALLLSRSLTGTGRGETSDRPIYFYRKNGTLPERGVAVGVFVVLLEGGTTNGTALHFCIVSRCTRGEKATLNAAGGFARLWE